jgi:hypothetical protein
VHILLHIQTQFSILIACILAFQQKAVPLQQIICTHIGDLRKPPLTKKWNVNI